MPRSWGLVSVSIFTSVIELQLQQSRWDHLWLSLPIQDVFVSINTPIKPYSGYNTMAQLY